MTSDDNTSGLVPQRQMTFDHNSPNLAPQRHKASDYDKSSLVPQLQEVSPPADKTETSLQELELLFSHMKALYRLKPAPRAWHDELSKFLISKGFSKGTIDPTLFTIRYGEDILLSNYALEILKKHDKDKCDSIGTLMATSPLDADLNGKPIDQTNYQSMKESLMYLTSTRPDLVQVVCYCTRYQARPTEKHLIEVKRIFRYLKKTINMGLWYSKDSGFELTAFSNADHASFIDTRKITSGGIQFLGDNLIIITEYLVNISKRRAFWSLNEDILKITILTTNKSYPSRKIRRIYACTHQRPRRKRDQYAVSREDQYAVLEIQYVNILEDIKRDPYSKKLPICIQHIGYERIFKKRTKRKPKASNSKHGVEKGKVKSQQSKKIQLEGPKLPKPQVVLQKRKTRVKIAKKVEIAFKLYNLRGPFLPTPQKVFFPAPKNPVTTGMSSHTFYPAKPLFSIAKIISSTLLTHPSCIKAMLAIPHLSQVSSMAEIALQRSTNKIKGWDLL
ncbi:hypothetical protein Tco_0084241 [Tanacetum coccineum]